MLSKHSHRPERLKLLCFAVDVLRMNDARPVARIDTGPIPWLGTVMFRVARFYSGHVQAKL